MWVAPELGNSSYVLRVPEAQATAIIDPLRDVSGYLRYLQRFPRRRLLSLETHIHNDFVSGSRELAANADTVIGASAQADLRYPYMPLEDGAHLALGNWAIKVLATPGHTPEHVSFLLLDPKGDPRALFSGGALMVGGAARTDLLGMPLARQLARKLYYSMRERFITLPRDTLLLPTHGAGSFCGATTGEKRTSTLGEERAANPLLRARSLEAFMSVILEQGPYPTYFRRMRSLNSTGAKRGDGTFPLPMILTMEQWDRLVSEGAAVIDTRDSERYDAGHIPGSYAVGADGPVSAWVGWLLPPERALLLLSQDEEEAREATRQLYRIGYDSVKGYLANGINTWRRAGRPVKTTPTLDGAELVQRLLAEDDPVLIDVREPREWVASHVPGSLNIPTATIPSHVSELPRNVPLLVHCAHGYRSSIATSLFEQAGFTDVVHVTGDFEQWKRVFSPSSQ
jgi:hydroxyacylglutathione hydrolase